MPSKKALDIKIPSHDEVQKSSVGTLKDNYREVDLKAFCKKENLETTGGKTALATRMKEYIKNNPTVEDDGAPKRKSMRKSQRRSTPSKGLYAPAVAVVSTIVNEGGGIIPDETIEMVLEVVAACWLKSQLGIK